MSADRDWGVCIVTGQYSTRSVAGYFHSVVDRGQRLISTDFCSV
jgi:hypothetical protein